MLAALCPAPPLPKPTTSTQSLRALLGLCPSDEARLELLGEAAGLLRGAAPGAFPPHELRWLVTAAWNRGTVHARFGRAREARSFMGWAAAALAHDAGLRGQYEVGAGAWGVLVPAGSGGRHACMRACVTLPATARRLTPAAPPACCTCCYTCLLPFSASQQDLMRSELARAEGEGALGEAAA